MPADVNPNAHSLALNQLCDAAAAFQGPDAASWATINALRFFALEYAAAYVRYVHGRDPELAAPGNGRTTVAAMLELLAEGIKR